MNRSIRGSARLRLHRNVAFDCEIDRVSYLHHNVPSSDRFVRLLSTSSTFSLTPTLPSHSPSNHCRTSFSVDARLPLSPISPFTTFAIIFSEGSAKPACGYSLYAGRPRGAGVSLAASAEAVDESLKKIDRTLPWLISLSVEGDQAARSFRFSFSRCVTPVTKSGAMSGF